MIRFNPIYNKEPHGAVTQLDVTTMTVWLHEDYYLQNLSLILTNDATHMAQRFLLTETGDTHDHYRRFTVTIPPQAIGLYFYHFELQFSDSVGYLKAQQLDAIQTMDANAYESWQLTVYDAAFSTPEWFKGSIMYQIFPDRFKRSKTYTAPAAANEAIRVRHDNWHDLPYSPITHPNYHAEDFFMGNLAGIHEELDYFKGLHVDSLYLNPIVESPENHRYSTADYFNVDPYLGTVDDFHALTTDFRQEGIRVILDGVYSHTGADSLYFNREGHYPTVGAYQSPSSPYYDWYMFRHFPDVYESWWGFINLPTVVKENPSYQDFIFNPETGVMAFWNRLGIGGWRIDVADEFPDSFLDQLRVATKRAGDEQLLIGEVWEDATTKFSYGGRRRYFLGKQFDSVMNYPWRGAIIEFIKHGDAAQFATEIMSLVEHYPRPALHSLMNLLTTHDTERILTTFAFEDTEQVPIQERPTYRLSDEQYALATERLKRASFLQFTLPGVPSIYYGDEIGMYGFRDPYNRQTFTPEKADTDLLSHYQSLTAFRNDYRDAFTSDITIVYQSEGCIAYTRGQLLCIVNISNTPHFIQTEHPAQLVFGEDLITTPYGVVAGPNAYGAIDNY